MTTKNKETARAEFLEMIAESWTWERLTDAERARCRSELTECKLFGAWRQRWEMLQSVYSAFLAGCGYEPQGWRETDEERAERLARKLMRIDNTIDRPCRPYGSKQIAIIRELTERARETVETAPAEILAAALDILTTENHHTMRTAAGIAAGLDTLEMYEEMERAFCDQCGIDYTTGKSFK